MFRKDLKLYRRSGPLFLSDIEAFTKSFSHLKA